LHTICTQSCELALEFRMELEFLKRSIFTPICVFLAQAIWIISHLPFVYRAIRLACQLDSIHQPLLSVASLLDPHFP